MKDAYVGDFNDFVKFALLRALCVPPAPSLHVAWLKTAGDPGRDGRRVQYLRKPHLFRTIDPILFDSLQKIVDDEARGLSQIETSDILPATRFFSDALPENEEAREEYFGRISSEAAPGLVFFDPDNGFAPPSVRKGRRGSDRFLFWDELGTTYNDGHSVIVYQHFPRIERTQFVAALVQNAFDATAAALVITIQTAHVVFVLTLQARHVAAIRRRIIAFAGRASAVVRATGIEEPRLHVAKGT